VRTKNQKAEAVSVEVRYLRMLKWVHEAPTLLKNMGPKPVGKWKGRISIAEEAFALDVCQD